MLNTHHIELFSGRKECGRVLVYSPIITQCCIQNAKVVNDSMDFRRVVFHCIVFLLPKQIKICNKIVEGFLLCAGRKCINASAYGISMDLLIFLDTGKKD